jgi:addiction module RelB/DinJ family antitoxin
MNTAIINIKTDKILKKNAQGIAKNFGLPLSSIINTYLREFVQEKRIVFCEPPSFNVKTQKIIDQALKDIKTSKNTIGPFDCVKEMDEFLDSLNK